MVAPTCASICNRIVGLGKIAKPLFLNWSATRDGLNYKFKDPNYDIKQLALERASVTDILNYDQVQVTGSVQNANTQPGRVGERNGE